MFLRSKLENNSKLLIIILCCERISLHRSFKITFRNDNTQLEENQTEHQMDERSALSQDQPEGEEVESELTTQN